MTERLYGLSEASRMPAPFAERARVERIPMILESAANHDFPVIPATAMRPPAIGEPRPGMLKIVEAVLVLFGEPGFGRLMAQYLSGMAHGVAGALSQLVEEHPDPLALNRVMGAPQLGLDTMIPFAATTLIASIRATERELVLYGWDWTTWDSWQRSAIGTCLSLIEPPPDEGT